MSLKLSDFNYTLPEELIAKYPPARRGDSRLLTLETGSGQIRHHQFGELIDYLRAGDLLVFNDTRVIPARIFGHKATGGRIELLVERVLEDGRLLTQIRASKSPPAGTKLLFAEDQSGATLSARVEGRQGEFYVLRFSGDTDAAGVLQRIGHMPLPPYIDRSDEPLDQERYQTVFARNPGAVAAPTAGLHFTDELLHRLHSQGVEQCFLTLHVGAGTFQSVRVEDIADHRMHRELVRVGDEAVAAIERCRAVGGRVIAVGTTSVRSLEAAAQGGELRSFMGETDIFIYPGFEFRVVDAMITNFHLPQSTLLMLVSAFCDKKMLLDAYEEAIEQHYRFFSYGDAMFLFRSD